MKSTEKALKRIEKALKTIGALKSINKSWNNYEKTKKHNNFSYIIVTEASEMALCGVHALGSSTTDNQVQTQIDRHTDTETHHFNLKDKRSNAKQSDNNIVHHNHDNNQSCTPINRASNYIHEKKTMHFYRTSLSQRRRTKRASANVNELYSVVPRVFTHDLYPPHLTPPGSGMRKKRHLQEVHGGHDGDPPRATPLLSVILGGWERESSNASIVLVPRVFPHMCSSSFSHVSVLVPRGPAYLFTCSP